MIDRKKYKMSFKVFQNILHLPLHIYYNLQNKYFRTISGNTKYLCRFFKLIFRTDTLTLTIHIQEEKIKPHEFKLR